MLSISDARPGFPGSGRRSFLRVGALALGALGLPSLGVDRWGHPRRLAGRLDAGEPDASVTGTPDLAAEAAARCLRGRSVILLFLQGGPSHIELFDPKMTAPSEIRSIFGEVATTIPGVTFGGTFPRLAALADRFSIVRSFQSRNSGHTYGEVTSARNPLSAAGSALYTRVAGINDPATGMPSNVLVRPESVAAGLELGRNFETDALPTLTDPGKLGAAYRAFDPAGGGTLRENMELRLPVERFGDRRLLLERLDGLRRAVDRSAAAEGIDRYREQAFDVISRGVARAFDLSDEDPRTVESYDTSGLFRNEEVWRWGDMKRSTNLLGRQLLLARRLCEAGCGFVTVSDCGWDMHSNGNSPAGLGGMRWLGPQLDRAVAAFIEDVESRGLRDRILLVVTGEMGRTPRINGHGGRDHYGELTPLLLYGGGLEMGRVVGHSDRTASRPATTPYGPENLLATIFHVLFDVPGLRIAPRVPGDVGSAIAASAPIAELV